MAKLPQDFSNLYFSKIKETVARRYSVKKLLLKPSQNSQENTCDRVSFLKKILWHRCFPVNFAKFLRIPFFILSSRSRTHSPSRPFSTTNHACGSMYNVQRVNVSHFCHFCSHHIFTKNDLPFCSRDTAKLCFPSLFSFSFSGPYFPGFKLNTEIYEVPLRIQSEWEKIRSTKTPNTHTFHIVMMVSSVLFWFCFLRVPYIREIKISSLLNFHKHD